MLNGKKILIGITGSIAAFKIPYLVRLLIKEGAEVQVVMTEKARDFVTPLTLSTLSKKPVYTQPFHPEDGTWTNHVELGSWADVMLIAPATAVTLSKMASGLADNLLMAIYLSARCPVFFAPAMDMDMYHHPSTQKNIAQLVQYGHHLIEPQVGELASGLSGAGRMEEPENIVQILASFFRKNQQLAGKKVLVTAGPTYEPIDPVRFIGNHSSGRMGFALAEECALRGAEVTLITGPVQLSVNCPGVNRINVSTANEMYQEVLAHAPSADIILMAAAVADYTPETPSVQKLKKSSGNLTLSLKPTPDILYHLGKMKKSGQILIGFALETHDEESHAREKLRNKNLDLIVLNSLNEQGAGFGYETNKVSILSRDGSWTHFPLKSKKEVASDIMDKVAEFIQ